MDASTNTESYGTIASSPPLPQSFSLPSTIIYSMLKNSSTPFGLQKLYQTCKYFFEKNPILLFTENFYYSCDFYNGSELKVVNPSAMKWYCNELYIEELFFIDTSKVYRCTIHTLTLKGTPIAYENFQVLVAENTIKNCSIKDANIFYTNKLDISMDTLAEDMPKILKFFTYEERTVYIEGILECLPNIVSFYYSSRKDSFNLKTMEKLNTLKFWNKFKNLELMLHQIPLDITKPLLCDFILRNTSASSEVMFDFLTENPRPWINYFEKAFDEWEGEKPQAKSKSFLLGVMPFETNRSL